MEAHGSGWDDIWNVGKNHFWDRGQTCQALVDAVEARQQPGDLFYPFTTDGRRKKVLVPVLDSSFLTTLSEKMQFYC